MTRARATTPERRRRREQGWVLATFALAALAGVVAAHFGTHRVWERRPPTASSSTSVPSADPQRSP